MTEQGAQYDHIGTRYEEYARKATLKRAERYTFLRMVGALDGKSVMDLACGFGFYTRLLKQHGAAQVVRIDISPEMIRLAAQQERAEPLGITYQVCDAVALPQLGPFDLVTAAYLLNYAESQDQMLGMFRSVYDNLAAGGRFVAYTVNPYFSINKASFTKYGATMLEETLERDRYACVAEFNIDPPATVRFYRWGQDTYEQAAREAGFAHTVWQPREVSPEDVARYGEAYWQDFHDNCLSIGLVCQK